MDLNNDALSKTYGVTEIFYSIAGEGNHVGTPTVFIRFSGCNLQCKWKNGECDTDFKLRNRMTAKEICDLAHSFGCNRITLTGGEPALQVDAPLLKALKLALPSCNISMETNGTVDLADKGIFHLLDWVTISPKFSQGLKIAQRVGNELKVIFPDEFYFMGNVFEFETFKVDHYYIQPITCTDYDVNIENAVALVKSLPKWKLSIQLHKFLGLQ